MAEIQRIIDWLGCLTTKQHRCGECPFNPHPGMHWPYGCTKGQDDIVEAAREALRKAEQVVLCCDCEYCHPIFCAPDGSPACDGSFSCGDTDIDYYAPSYHMDTYFCASGKRRNEDVSKD